MRLFRHRKKEPRLQSMGEAEAYGRSYGDQSRDVRVLKVEPPRPRYPLLAKGELLRRAFLERLNAREGAHAPPEKDDGADGS